MITEDLKFGNEVIKYDLSDRASIRVIALIAGDAFHNLKCALDYAWVETITRLAPIALLNFAKFPVYSTKDLLEAPLRGHGIEKSSPALFRLMLDEIKPYETGDYAIWPIHRLDIRDKHRLLIPTVLYTSISGIETQGEAGDIRRDGFTLGTHQNPPWYVPMRVGVKVNNKGKVSIAVSFDYGDKGDEAVFADSLNMYSQRILGVVKALEALVETV